MRSVRTRLDFGFDPAGEGIPGQRHEEILAQHVAGMNRGKIRHESLA